MVTVNVHWWTVHFSPFAYNSIRVDTVTRLSPDCHGAAAIPAGGLIGWNSMTPGQIINGLERGKFASLGKVAPAGSLEARLLATGTTLYWRFTMDGKTAREVIGIYDPAAPPKSFKPTERGYSFAAAMREAERRAMGHHQHRAEGGRPALLAAQKVAKHTASEAKRVAAQQTLSNLLDAYCDHLKAIGRRSHSDARSIFKLHIKEAWPKVAALPAKDVTGEQFADMMRTLIEARKGRTANKLRSYARAAYQMAKAAKSKPSIPVAFKDYGIVVNPVADTEPDESQNKPDKRPMSAAEMRSYWQAIKPMPGFKGALLRLHLLTGGQRIEQLVNLLTANTAPDFILLYDGKGRPGQPPRPHRVPLTKEAATALNECKPAGVFALSTDGGASHAAATSLSHWAAEAIGETVQDFQAKRIRSGVETLLASAGVSQDIRGRLQSHGVAGVQARHYDGHEYMSEKRKALTTLHKLLEATK
ncbi:integrase [Variovorax sp. LG9.2]|uniref:integrase n=1 Tax=Variovorax sp. LG9.2 TaxID=3048626 RepID=UPI002B224BDF|nr:integrase [Variovorax sp. LG9.2]MEB0060046.1 integrase [Variovorax sp. LG9.2]